MARHSLYVLPLSVLLILSLGVASVWGKAGDYANRLAIQTERYADAAAAEDTGLSDSLMRVATALYRAAADSGNTDAASYLGFLYYNGRGVKHDVDSALYWLSAAGDAGNIKASYNLGWLLLQGEGIPHDTLRAVELIKKAADNNLPVAQATLADFYLTETQCMRDSALKLMKKAALRGFIPAQERIINIMRDDWGKLSPADALAEGLDFYNAEAPMVGVILFNIAADKASRGINDALDMHIDTDTLRGIRGHAYALLGDAYSRNNGVRYNHALSLDNFARGALDGNPSAQFVLGELLEFFPDALDERPEVTDSMKTASYWLDKAANAGIRNADEAERMLLGK